MSTHCMIGRASADGTVRAIYVHYDGCPEKKYPLLNTFLDVEQEIDKILAKGDLNSLSARPILRALAHRPDALILAADELEPAMPAREYANILAFLRGAYNEAAHYAYLWIAGTWVTFHERAGIWEVLPIRPDWSEQEMIAYCTGDAR